LDFIPNHPLSIQADCVVGKLDRPLAVCDAFVHCYNNDNAVKAEKTHVAEG